MESFHRAQGPVILGSACALITMASQFFNIKELSTATTLLKNNAILISAFMIGIGVINLMLVNYRYIQSRRKGLWMYASIYLLLVPILTILGIMKNPTYTFAFNNVSVPIQQSVDAFVTFFIVQGMYRAMRIRNIESALMGVVTILIMLRKVPVGILIWPGIVPIGDWLLQVCAVAGTRALVIIFGFSVVSMSIRTILGHERSHVGEREIG